MTWLFCLLVLAAATGIDFAHVRHVQAVGAGRAHAAALWSVAQWASATVGFVVAVRVSMWVLPFEAAGLYAGSLLAVTCPVQDQDPTRTC